MTQPVDLAAHLDAESADYWLTNHCARTEAHPAHPVQTTDRASICPGVEGGLAAQIANLRPGQRVRVVIEGVVDQPHPEWYPNRRDAVAVVGPNNSDRTVLRYVGAHPSEVVNDLSAPVQGKVHDGLVSVEVLDA